MARINIILRIIDAVCPGNATLPGNRQDLKTSQRRKHKVREYNFLFLISAANDISSQER
jgi:hypothetical protein